MTKQIIEGRCPECGKKHDLSRGAWVSCDCGLFWNVIYEKHFAGYIPTDRVGLPQGPLLPATPVEKFELRQVSCPECECGFSVDIYAANKAQPPNQGGEIER